MNVLVIDNYDSFTYNLVHYLGELGAKVVVRRNDKITVDEVAAMDPDAIVISPGPCTPNEAGICLELIERLGPKIPIFGVCLGHQAIGQVYGGNVVRAPTLMHGKVSEIRHTGRGVFRGINGNFKATRYHSLPGRAGDHAGGAGGDRDRRRRRHHGRDAQDQPGPRRAVPPGVDRLRARPPDPEEFPRPRRALERQAPRRAERWPDMAGPQGHHRQGRRRRRS